VPGSTTQGNESKLPSYASEIAQIVCRFLKPARVYFLHSFCEQHCCPPTLPLSVGKKSH
jgi:hypothetical protein